MQMLDLAVVPNTMTPPGVVGAIIQLRRQSDHAGRFTLGESVVLVSRLGGVEYEGTATYRGGGALEVTKWNRVPFGVGQFRRAEPAEIPLPPPGRGESHLKVWTADGGWQSVELVTAATLADLRALLVRLLDTSTAHTDECLSQEHQPCNCDADALIERAASGLRPGVIEGVRA